MSTTSESTVTMPIRVALIGAGSMGGGMALHLAELSTYEVIAYDSWEPGLAQFTASYEEVCKNQSMIARQRSIKNLSDIASDAFVPDVVIFMVVNSKQISDILFSTINNGDTYLSTLSRNTTILIQSTCSPSDVLSIAEKIQSSYSTNPSDAPSLIDAPVSGGPVKARAGTMSIMMSQQTAPSGSDIPKYLQVLRSLSAEV